MMINNPACNLANWSVQILCSGKGNNKIGCGAVLLVEESDLFNSTRVIEHDHVVMQTSFCCTECKAHTDIDNVPTEIFNRLPSKREFLRK